MNKILIIIGSAPCVMEDITAVASAFSLQPSAHDFMAIGLDAVDKYSARVEYFATYHPAEIEASIERRKNAGGNTDWKIISHQEHNGLVDMIIPLIGTPSGSSALLGVHAGIQMNYEKIIVCGCPLTGSNDKGGSYEVFRAGWTAKLAEIKEKTRSMSGWTRELLGAPTKSWLEQGVATPCSEVRGEK